MFESGSLSRRNFIKGGALLGAGALGAATFSACSTGGGSDSVSWDKETDVLIVGSGFAGYAAALHAHDAGADVMIIDKRGNIGAIHSNAMAILRYATRQRRRSTVFKTR